MGEVLSKKTVVPGLLSAAQQSTRKKGTAKMPIKIQSGGGISSKVNVTPSIRTGAPARGVSPGWTSQQGTALGSHAQEAGSKVLNPVTPKFTNAPAGGSEKLGNQVALNVGKGGPGTGREVMRSGSQGQHGPAVRGNPPDSSGQIFPGFPGRRG
jgi:hypothetical protein